MHRGDDDEDDDDMDDGAIDDASNNLTERSSCVVYRMIDWLISLPLEVMVIT